LWIDPHLPAELNHRSRHEKRGILLHSDVLMEDERCRARGILVGVEFDGAQHWTDAAQRSRDIDRLAELEALGWTIVRVSAEMLRGRPGTVVARVRAAPSRRT
jgi:very-short-patch-repair endonuclease